MKKTVLKPSESITNPLKNELVSINEKFQELNEELLLLKKKESYSKFNYLNGKAFLRTIKMDYSILENTINIIYISDMSEENGVTYIDISYNKSKNICDIGIKNQVLYYFDSKYSEISHDEFMIHYSYVLKEISSKKPKI